MSEYATSVNSVVRTFEEENAFIHKIGECKYQIDKGFVPGMNCPAYFYANDNLLPLVEDELKIYCDSKDASHGGFIPAVKQVANVATLPGVVLSCGAPDMHTGYGFSIGGIAAMDMENPDAVVSPGGVGFDINCGVRLIRTNLTEKDVLPHKEELAQQLFDSIPVGVGSKGIMPVNKDTLAEVLNMGMDWSIREGYSFVEDKEHCEEFGRMLQADSSKVSTRAYQRGVPQLGTLGAGNHYTEVQVVDEIYDVHAAKKMGIEFVGQVCVMVHCGSRGLGHQIGTDYINIMEEYGSKNHIHLNDRQLACAPITSQEGQDYLKAMAAGANFAFVNRSSITYLIRQAFAKVFNSTPDDLDMQLIYDVSHNIAKEEYYTIDGKMKKFLVHRKGATRAFGPNHPMIPVDYQNIGQPILIGGSMGTCSYVLTGTEKAMTETFGSTCHGAGRAKSRASSRRDLDSKNVLQNLADKGISVRVASPNLIKEEAPESYKDVTEVVNTCHDAGISKKAFKLRPIAVIKG